MPNEKVLSEKKAIVESMTQRLKEASSGVIVDYKGINVAEDTELRRQLTGGKVEYSVFKNTLMRLAVKNVGLDGLTDVLKGSTSIATSKDDPIVPIRLISQYAKKLGDRFNIKAAFMEGRILSENEIADMAKLSSKDALYSVVLGTMLAPITSLAVVLNQIAEKMGGSAETAAEEAPAAETAE